MKYLKKAFVLLNIMIGFLLLGTGFVVEAANPVSVIISDCTEEFTDNNSDGRIFRLRIYLKEAQQINAFQFRVDFDNSVLKTYGQIKLADDFLNKYNSNNSALTSCKYNEKKSNIILLGLQVDDRLSNLDSGIVFSDIMFETGSMDVGESAKQLESIKFTVEVLEGENGNIVDNDSSWVIYANHNIKQEPVSEEDLKEDVGKYKENSNNYDTEISKNDDISKSGDLNKPDDSEKISNKDSGVQENNNRKDADVSSENSNDSRLEDSALNTDSKANLSDAAAEYSKDNDLKQPISHKKNSSKRKNRLNNYLVYIILGFVIVSAVIVFCVLNRKKNKNFPTDNKGKKIKDLPTGHKK